MGVLFKINLRWLMLICSRLSDINGENLVGINDHDDVPLVTEWRQLLFDFHLTSSHCPHPCPPLPIAVFLSLGCALGSAGGLVNYSCLGPTPRDSVSLVLGDVWASGFFKTPRWFQCPAKVDNHCSGVFPYLTLHHYFPG